MREKITWTWQKIVTAILGVLGIGTLTSCYGMPMNFRQITVSGTVTYDHDNNPETPAVPVKGIKVTPTMDIPFVDQYTEFVETDEDGKFFFYEYQDVAVPADYNAGKLSLEFSDVDGPENGSLKTETRSWDDIMLNKGLLNDVDFDAGTIQMKSEEPM